MYDWRVFELELENVEDSQLFQSKHQSFVIKQYLN